MTVIVLTYSITVFFTIALTHFAPEFQCAKLLTQSAVLFILGSKCNIACKIKIPVSVYLKLCTASIPCDRLQYSACVFM
uniref:Uncharacterized protein n=1 Tax=Anguilla anguilla TaxID=7936 RepID=A0A0E9WWK5_ANGAN